MDQKQFRGNFLFPAAAAGMLAALFVRQMFRVVTSQYVVESEKIPAPFNGFRIVQVSDLHNNQPICREGKLAARISALRPDIAVLTGDISDGLHGSPDVAVRFVRSLAAFTEVYYVPGNHEAAGRNRGIFFRRLKNAGAKLLFDRRETLRRGGGFVTLTGLLDPCFGRFYSLRVNTPPLGAIGITREGSRGCSPKGEQAEEFRHPATRSVWGEYPAACGGEVYSGKISDHMRTVTRLRDMRPADRRNFNMLLAHRPEQFPLYASNGFDLVFSGHAHGGQWRIPPFGGIFSPNQGLLPEYTAGIYRLAETQMVVSRGLGNTVMPVRINNPFELVLVTLKCRGTDGGKGAAPPGMFAETLSGRE